MTRRLFWTFLWCTSAPVRAGRKQGLSGSGDANLQDLLPNEHFDHDEIQATLRNGFRRHTSQRKRTFSKMSNLDATILGNDEQRFLRKDCAPNDSAVTLVLVTDNYGWETSWELSTANATGETVAKGPPEGGNYARNSRYVGSWCIAPGPYVLTMRDELGDGHCCKFGEGSVSIFIDGVLALQDSEDGDYDEKELPFTIEPKTMESITREPSWSPFTKPSLSPTADPIETPTFHPTERPTTPEPSIPPTPQPSLKPTEMPSFSPSRKPSSKPTERPTSNPTGKPTLQPSQSPTTEPTPRDTNVPSFTPSEGATSTAPTFKPSRKPIPKPSPYPTDVPSVEPSFAPSFSPFKNEPSISPISKPMKKPTIQPTQIPIHKLTRGNTNMPSFSPSEGVMSKSPTFKPMRKPSSTPSQSPTREPTISPTNIMSFQPSAMITLSTTLKPSLSSTSVPFALSTEVPSLPPPSEAPSTAPPIGKPTSEPLKFSTDETTPSDTNTASSPPSSTTTFEFPPQKPTKKPTPKPSKSPTSPPTVIDMNVPSFYPSAGSSSSTQNLRPTRKPTIKPTQSPIDAPTPSFSPSEEATFKLSTTTSTGKPTLEPSQFPTEEPTRIDMKIPSSSPSFVTLDPTGKPTVDPSQPPTDEPTYVNANVPSFSPSIRTTSISPTFMPSKEPTTDLSQSGIQPTLMQESTFMPSNTPSTMIYEKIYSHSKSVLPTLVYSESPSNHPTVNTISLPSLEPSSKSFEFFLPSSKSPTVSASNQHLPSPTSINDLRSQFPSTRQKNMLSDIPSIRPNGIISFSPSLFPSELTYENETLTSGVNSTSGRISPSQAPTKAIVDGNHSASKFTTTYYITLKDFEFTMSYTDMKGNIDIDELSEKLSNHLLHYFRKAFPENDHIVDIKVRVVELSDTLKHKGSSKFRASIKAVFNETSISSIEDLNNFTVDAFTGDGYDDFLTSLGNSSDSTLRSITTINISSKTTNNPVLGSREDFLSTEDDGTSSMGSVFLWIGLISIGVILAAIFVVSQRRAREAEEENDDNSTISTYEHDLLPCVVEVDTPSRKSFPQLDNSSGLDSESGPKWSGLLQTDPEENRGKKETPPNMFPSSQKKVDCTNQNDLPNFSSTHSSNPSSNSCFSSPSTHSSGPSSSAPTTNKQEQISGRATRHEEITKHDQYQNDFQSSSTRYESTGNDKSTSTTDNNNRIDGEIINATCLSEERSASHIPTKSDHYLLPHNGVNMVHSSSVIVASGESHNGDIIEIVAKNRITTADPKAKEPSQHRVERDKSKFLSKLVRSIIKRSTKDSDSIHVNASKSVSFSESVLSHSQSVRSRDFSKIGSSDQIAAENSSDSWTETNAHASKRSSESEEPSIRGDPPNFFALIQACTGSCHEGDNFEMQQGSGTPGVEDGMLATEEDEESIFRTMIQSLTATSHEGQNLEVQPTADFPDFIIDTTASEFRDIDDNAKIEVSTNIRDEVSKTSKTSTGKRSLISKVKGAVSKSSSNVYGDQRYYTTSSIDVTKNLKSRASKLLSPPKSKIVSTGEYENRGIRGTYSEKMDPKWGTVNSEASSWEQEEGNCDFRTMIQVNTATSHEGHNFEIQPKVLFLDIVTDINPGKATSIQEEMSNTSTVSTGKRTLFSKVKSIVSKPPLKIDEDYLALSPSDSEHAREGQPKESASFSHSNSRGVVVNQYDSRGSYDSYNDKIDPKCGTFNRGASSWEQEEGQSLFHTMIQALTATSHEGQNFEIRQKAEFSDVETNTPNSAEATTFQEELSSKPTGSTGKRPRPSKFNTVVSKNPSKFAGNSLAFSTSINDLAKEVESQSNSKSVSLNECDYRESCDSCSKKSYPNWDTTNSVASLLKLQEEGNAFQTIMQALTATSHEGQNFENQPGDEFTDMKNNALNSVRAMSNQEELSKRSHSSKFSHAFSKSSSKCEDDPLALSSSKNDISREIESTASIPPSPKCACFSEYDFRDSYDSYSEKFDSIWGTANSEGSSWEQAEEGSDNFHTMIQTLPATSHEGQNIEIQPNDEFPDNDLDALSEKATSIQEQFSKTSTGSTRTRSFLRKVKYIVSKPLPKYEDDSLAFTRSTDIKVASGLESEVCTSPSRSNSRNVSASENVSQYQRGSWDTSSYRINPNWEVDSSHASTWNELEQTSIQCSLGPECLSTISGASSEEDNDSGTTISSEEDNDTGTTGSADSTVSSISTAT